MNKALNKILGSLATAAKPTRPSQNKNSRTRRRRPVPNNQIRQALPSAYAAHVRPRFNVNNSGQSTVRVAGADLVYPIPSTVINGDGDTLFVAIPANPCYWSGTRIGQFAPAYMNYRPIQVRFSYIPQVAVTQQGTVFMGTLWNGAAAQDDIQQTLFTSNGGCLTQCYIPCDTTIKLGTNLQQNLFTCAGPITPDSSPFFFFAGVRGATVVPGYFYVSYVYEFKNPVGSSWTYTTSSRLTEPVDGHMNSSLVLLAQNGNLGPGTIIDVETGGLTYYHGSPVSITSAFVQFSCDQSSISASRMINSNLTVSYTAAVGGLSMPGRTAELTHTSSSTVKSSAGFYINDRETYYEIAAYYGGTNYSIPADSYYETFAASPLTDLSFVDEAGNTVFALSTTSSSSGKFQLPKNLYKFDL